MMKKLCLNLGSGSRPLPNYVNIDKEDKDNVDVVWDLEEGIPYDNGTVDVIYCKCVFEHLKNPNLFLAEAFRVLKKGGHLTIITDNACCVAHYLPFKRIGRIHVGTHVTNEFEHYAIYTKQDMERHLKVFNFASVEVGFIKGAGKWFSLFIRAEVVK